MRGHVNIPMPSVMSASQHFSQMPNADIERAVFDRSHGYKTTFDGGFLIPFYVDEALPGDTFNLSMQGFARLATPIKPFMDNLRLETFFFAIPYRLVWNNWERFNGAQDDPNDTIDYVIPQVVTPGAAWGLHSLADYMGVPPSLAGVSVSALPFRAYMLVWNEWFRDENLQDSIVVAKGDGPDDETLYRNVLRRGKRPDYFTTCLPWPQKGLAGAVKIPIGVTAPVVANVSNPHIKFRIPTAGGTVDAYAGGSSGVTSMIWRDAANATVTPNVSTRFPLGTGVTDQGLLVDFTAAAAQIGTINELRQAFQIQRLLERDARGGTRYIEVIKSHFGVTSPDARLQRPEYLGGGSTPVTVSPVAQTAISGSTPQGNLAGVGTVSWSGHGFTKSFTEHCLVLGIANVRADLTYQQGLERMWFRSTRYDHYWPALAHIGEQGVYLGEIYMQGSPNASQNKGVIFGYQERYGEYRHKPSQITGLFRSSAPGTLQVWHLAQQFGSAPSLNAAFIVDDPPIDRVIAVPAEPHFLFDAYIKLRCARPMPVYGIPGMADHF